MVARKGNCPICNNPWGKDIDYVDVIRIHFKDKEKDVI